MSGSLFERVFDAKLDMVELQRKMQFQHGKTDISRLLIVEESIVKLAQAFEVILEAKEKKLWPV